MANRMKETTEKLDLSNASSELIERIEQIISAIDDEIVGYKYQDGSEIFSNNNLLYWSKDLKHLERWNVIFDRRRPIKNERWGTYFKVNISNFNSLKEEIDYISIQSKRHQKESKYPCSKWEDITFKFLDDENVEIVVDKLITRINYADMGFENKRKGCPDEKWILLKAFACNNGEIDQRLLSDKDRNNLKSKKKVLCERLRREFGLTDNPFWSGSKSAPHICRMKLEYYESEINHCQSEEEHSDSEDIKEIIENAANPHNLVRPAIDEYPQQYRKDDI